MTAIRGVTTVNTAGTISFFYTGSATAFSGAPAANVTVFYQKSTSQDGINVTSGNNQASAVNGNQSGRGDFDTGNVRYKSRERYSFGWSDPLGIFGSPGSS